MALTGARSAFLLAICLSAPAWSADPSAEAKATFERGLAADLGTNGHPDPELAYRCYLQAAQLGDADAELDLGVMNDSGVGTLADATQAAVWYARAAAHGNARAAFDLGQLYEAGDGVPQNRELAAAWFTLAHREGIEAASSRADRLLGGAGPSTPPGAPTMVAPAPGSVLRTGDVELVWMPPANGAGTSYWVQVRSATTGQTVIYQHTDVSAMLVHLAAGSDFTWRVFAAGPGHYQASAWSSFAVRGGELRRLALTSR